MYFESKPQAKMQICSVLLSLQADGARRDEADKKEDLAVHQGTVLVRLLSISFCRVMMLHILWHHRLDLIHTVLRMTLSLAETNT